MKIIDTMERIRINLSRLEKKTKKRNSRRKGRTKKTSRESLSLLVIGAITIFIPTLSTGFVLPTRSTLSSTSHPLSRKIKNTVSGTNGGNKGTILWDTSINNNDSTAHHYDDDWRAFRAQLVLNEKNILKEEVGKKDNDIFPESTFTTEMRSTLERKGEQEQDLEKNEDTSIASWIHEQTVLEVGSVLIHTPRPQDVCGLARQSLYRCVILIVETNTEQTMGILLNRPTDYCLIENDEDDIAISNVASFETAGIYFGGDESSLHTMEPKYYVLHHPAETSETMMNNRCEILPGLSLMNVEEAKRKLFDKNYRMKSKSTGEEDDTIEYYKEFTTYSGHILWDTLELEAELEHDMWTSLSIDSLTLRNALHKQKQQENSDEGSVIDDDMLRKYLLSRAGLEHKIDDASNTHRGDKIKKYNYHLHNFDQRMFEEWRRTYLKWEGDNDDGGDENTGSIELHLKPGDLVRSTETSSANEFLFHDQEFQKSLVLILQDDEDLTVGVLLSHPTTKSCEIHEKKEQQFWFPSFPSFPTKLPSLPIRYGGNFLHFQNEGDEEGNEEQTEIPPFCLHYLGGTVGEPIGNYGGDSSSVFPIYKASIEQASEAILMGIASPSDFIIVQGMTVWPKEFSRSGSRCLASSGCFERVPHQQVPRIWNMLSTQKPLSPSNMESNIDIARQAWKIATAVENNNNRSPSFPIITTSSAISSSLKNMNNDGSSSSHDNIEEYQPQEASSENKQSTIAAKTDKQQTIMYNDLGFDAVKTWLKLYLLENQME